VLNNERTRQRSKKTTIAFLGNTESVVVTTYIIILNIDEFVRRTVLGKERGGIVMSTAGTVSIRLAALDMATSGITPRSEELGRLEYEANIHKGKTSATVIAILAAINVLKEKRRRRFVAAGGVEPRIDAYREIVHDDEKTNAEVVIPCQRTPGLCQRRSVDVVPFMWA